MVSIFPDTYQSVSTQKETAMMTEEQQELVQELLELHENRSPFLDEQWQKPDPQRYRCPETFARERERIFRALPQIAAHSSELPRAGDFLTLELAGRPVLLTRAEDGSPRAFYNVCRHRGAQLVGESAGCKHRFSCPYHAWTWNNTGELIAVPHEKSGFPGLNREEFGLHPIACEEYAGWLWVSLDGSDQIDVESHLGGIGPDILAMDAGNYRIFDSSDRDIAANWKILVEGGIESYHFRVAHRNTIAPLFLDNLSSYRCFGDHIRSVLPRSTLPELKTQAPADWSLAEHANILYSLLPGSQFLVQEDHFVWIQAQPLAPNQTRLRLSTLVPASEHRAEKADYWRRHHQLTLTTLDEDFSLGEGIQKNLDSGVNQHLNFGRFEGALARFNASVERALGD